MSAGACRSIVCDTDCGIDDAAALVVLLSQCPPASESARAPRLLAVTTVAGNVSARQAAVNVRAIFAHFGREDVPVFEGCASSVLGGDTPTWPGHGEDGLGGWTEARGVGGGSGEGEHAVNAMVRLLRENPGSDVVALGPLTNVAMAMRLDPAAAESLRSVHVMGGSAVGRGNASPSAEFNLLFDPEAAHVVFGALGADRLVVATWELTEAAGLSWAEFDRLVGRPAGDGGGAGRGGRARQFFADVFALAERMTRGAAAGGADPPPQPPPHPLGLPSPTPAARMVHAPHEAPCDFLVCDAVAVALLLRPGLATGARALRCEVALSGRARGSLQVAWYDHVHPAAGRPNACVVESVERAGVVALLEEAAERLSFLHSSESEED